ncbi:MAG: exosortase/archaeosortase family protein [Planctomycetaceae bacterium]|nr:exosortase/archaeosortase family protein [Planctomycetaceae bacterium]
MTATTVSNNINTDPSGQLEVTQRQAIIAGAVALVCFVGAFFEWFRSQARWAIEAPSDWGHTLLIPFIAGWFVWLKRDQLRVIPIRPVWSALVLVILGVVAYALCTLGPAALQHHNIRGAGVSLSLFGLALLVFGWGWMRWLWFPILYAVVFGQRISERFISVATYKLQDISAKGAYLFLSMFGMDVDLAGNVLTVHGGGQPHMLNVAEACSGMRMLVAFMALGVAMAYVSLPTLWQRVSLVLLGIPIAIFVNVLRVASLGLLSMLDGEFAAGEFHHFVGLVWLVPAFLLYLFALWVLTNMVVQQPTTPEVPHAR